MVYATAVPFVKGLKTAYENTSTHWLRMINIRRVSCWDQTSNELVKIVR